MKSSFTQTRKFKYGSVATAFTVAFIAFVVIFNIIFTALASKYNWFVDMTKEQVFTLSEEAKEIMADVTEDVYLYFASEPDELMNGQNSSYTRYIYTTALQLEEEFENVHVDAVSVLKNPSFFRAIYQISGIWEGAGYGSIVFFSAIIAISPTSYEAAQIDGANKWAQMRYVVLPSMLSTIVIMLITRIGTLLSIGYEKVLLLYDTSTYVTADVVSTFAQRHGMQGATTTGLASAAEMMNNVIGMLLVIGANTIARKASNTSLY